MDGDGAVACVAAAAKGNGGVEIQDPAVGHYNLNIAFQRHRSDDLTEAGNADESASCGPRVGFERGRLGRSCPALQIDMPGNSSKQRPKRPGLIEKDRAAGTDGEMAFEGI